jgi:hypothetical protein
MMLPEHRDRQISLQRAIFAGGRRRRSTRCGLARTSPPCAGRRDRRRADASPLLLARFFSMYLRRCGSWLLRLSLALPGKMYGAELFRVAMGFTSLRYRRHEPLADERVCTASTTI